MPKGIYERTKEHNKKVSIALTGRKLPIEVKQKMSLSRRFDKHYNWKGDKVGYRALHTWVEKKLGKPSFCNFCERTEPPEGKGHKRSYFQWANVSQEYKRDIYDWVRLCYLCHNKFSKNNLISNE